MKIKWILVILVTVVCVALAVFKIYTPALQKSYAAATSSCLKSVAEAIRAAPNSLSQISPLGAEWRVLPQSDFLKLSSQLKLGDLDCRTANGEIRDRWGRSIKLVVRKVGEGLQFKVLSVGADGVEGTDDDIVEVSQQ